MPSPTSRSLAYLRRSGYITAVVERWVERLKIRMDVWHFADLLACHGERREIVLIQTTTLNNLSARIAKTRKQPESALWLAAGGRVHLHGWSKRDGRWTVKVVELLAGDVAPVVIAAPPRKKRASPWHAPDLFTDTCPDVPGTTSSSSPKGPPP
jgi:hypothetical protein